MGYTPLGLAGHAIVSMHSHNHKAFMQNSMAQPLLTGTCRSPGVSGGVGGRQLPICVVTGPDASYKYTSMHEM